MSLYSLPVLMRNLAKQNYFKLRSSYNLHQKISDTSGFTKPSNKPTAGEKRTKKPSLPKITLVSPDNTISVTNIEEAQKLSKRRDLKLVKIIDIDTKTQRPVYKLMTGAEYHAEDLKRREERKKEKNIGLKGEKLLILSSKIAEHDLVAKVNMIIKWIQKNYEVRVTINSDGNMNGAEKTYHFLEARLKNETRLVQKRIKGTDIKFQLIPPKKNSSESEPPS